VEDAERVLRRAVEVFHARAVDERPRKRGTLAKKAERVLRARLHFLKVKLAAAQYAGPQDDHEKHAQEAERLLRAQRALTSGGVHALLVEFGAGDAIEGPQK
jgi:hypothetical protein